MKPTRHILPVAHLAGVAAPAAHAEVAFDVIGDSEISFEGLLQADANWFDEDVANLNGDIGDGRDSDSELRRAELVFKGKGPGNIEWVAGYDAKADKFLDVNAKYKLGGNANHYLQLGQFKQPNSLEELSSTKNNDFISKAMVTNTFAVARRLGAAYSYGDANWSITGSYFERELTRNLAHGNGFGLRGTWAPINEAGHVLHMGLSYVDYDTDTDFVRIRTRPNADLSNARLVDTGATGLRNADRQATLGAEGMYVQGPFKVQGEYMRSKVDRYASATVNPSGSDFTGDSWYVSGVWNITGETWGYKAGVPTTPLPNSPATGMFQLGLRYDAIDLNDGSVRPGATPAALPLVDGLLGGKMDALTLGANWYWRSNFKFMLNYVKVNSSKYSTVARGDVNDDPSIIEARVQLYW